MGLAWSHDFLPVVVMGHADRLGLGYMLTLRNPGRPRCPCRRKKGFGLHGSRSDPGLLTRVLPRLRGNLLQATDTINE